MIVRILWIISSYISNTNTVVENCKRGVPFLGKEKKYLSAPTFIIIIYPCR